MTESTANIEAFECCARGCKKSKEKRGDLLCAEHWKALPRPLKRRLLDGEKLRSENAKRSALYVAAHETLDWIQNNEATHG